MENPISSRKKLSRRSFLHIAALTGVAGVAGATRFFPFSPNDPKIITVRESFPLMGTQEKNG